MYDQAKTIRIQDIDHIMPKSILESLSYDLSKINSIKNFQLIDYGTNRGEKNGKAFAEWINNPAYVSDKPAFIKLHLIPNDETIWTEDKFEEFIEARAKLILTKLAKYTTTFSGIGIGLNKTVDSSQTPMINLVSEPNDWSKQLQKANSFSPLTEKKLLQQEYWQALKNFMEDNKSFIRMRNPLPQSYSDYSLGKSNIYLSATVNARDKSINIWLNIMGEHAKENFDKLYELFYENSLKEVNKDLIWDRMEGRKMSMVILKSKAVITDKSDWANQFNWFLGNLERFIKYFKPRITNI
jgi:hypothetical protein